MAALPENLYEVFVLQEGYSYTDSEGKYRATCTCTLVTGKHLNILIDTGSPWDGKNLIDGLQNHGLKPEDVNYVICTHGHVDHVGNLSLFPNATHIVSNDICHKKDIYTDHPFKEGVPYCVDGDMLQVIPTPGHTHSDISVLVKGTKYGNVVACGDLFEFEHDEKVWRDISECPAMQEEHRKHVKQIADWIIPGHGRMFKVEKDNVDRS